MKGVLFDNEGTCVFSSFPSDTRDVYTRTLFILVTVQDPFPIVTLQDVYTITRRLFVVPERGGICPVLWFIYKLLMVWGYLMVWL